MDFLMRIKFLASFYYFFLLALFGCDDKNISIQSDAKLPHSNVSSSFTNDQKAVPSISQLNKTASVSGLIGTHCKSTETAYINAKMHKVVRNLTKNTTYELEPTDHVLSVCVSKDNLALSYRFGNINKVELERTASTQLPFGSYYRQVGTVGESILFFSDDEYHYYIINSGSMGSGVKVNVYKNNTLISELFSGNDPYNDFVIATDLNLPKKLVNEKQPFNHQMQ